ncbi:MAG: ABC transporter permease [Clostridiales bacterium]|jgi:spermidine/putrescine transport system permease protein|nr:ABC transporter permease [Clostridiales bacterium]
MKRAKKKELISLLAMVSPVSFWMALLIALPLIYILGISFCGTDEAHNIVLSPTLRNYARIFDPAIAGIYLNSLSVAGLATIFAILIGYPFAAIMANAKPFSKTLMYVALMLPFWTNCVIRLYAWRTILGSNGTLNFILLKLGLISKPLEIMFTRGAVVLGMVYTLLPFMVMPISTVLEKLDRGLLEASSDLGARPATTFLRVTLPLSAPGVFAGVIMVFIPALGFFFVSDLMGGGTSQLIGNLVERQFKESFNWPFGAALSVLLIAATLILVRLYTASGGQLDDLGAM